MSDTHAPVEFEILDPPARAFAGVPLPVAVVVRRPAVRAGAAELRQIGCRDGTVAVETDLFERDVVIRPGESYRCTVRVTFASPGAADLGSLFVEAGAPEAAWEQLVPAPARPLAVVPSLAREVEVRVDRVCGYELGTKVEVELVHTGATPFADFQVGVGPADRVRAGVTEHRRPSFGPGDRMSFDVVVAGPLVGLVLDAVGGGERVGPLPLDLPVPAGGAEVVSRPFRFLEPRRLTTDRVRVRAADEPGGDVPLEGGVFPVAAGGGRYQVSIYPTHPGVTGVTLHGVPGQVEVGEPARLDDGRWEFAVFVVLNPFLTTAARLYYDVDTPDGVLRGELPLSVRPTWRRHLVFAATLGVAVTLRGAAAVGKAVLSPEGVWDDAPELIDRLRPVDLAYLSSIPAVALGMRAADWVYRRFLDE